MTVVLGCYARQHAICISVFNFYFRHLQELNIALSVRRIELSPQKCAEMITVLRFRVCGFWRVVMVLIEFHLKMHFICTSVFSVCIADISSIYFCILSALN